MERYNLRDRNLKMSSTVISTGAISSSIFTPTEGLEGIEGGWLADQAARDAARLSTENAPSMFDPIGTPEREKQSPDLAQQPTSPLKAWGIADVMDTPLPVATQSLPVLSPNKNPPLDYYKNTSLTSLLNPPLDASLNPSLAPNDVGLTSHVPTSLEVAPTISQISARSQSALHKTGQVSVDIHHTQGSEASLFEFDVEPLGDSENITKHRRLDSPRKHLHDLAQTISRLRESPHTFVRERWIAAHEEARHSPAFKEPAPRSAAIGLPVQS